jgi:hypothetical protein
MFGFASSRRSGKLVPGLVFAIRCRVRVVDVFSEG